MAHSQSDSRLFVNESAYALEHFFAIIAARDKALRELSQRIDQLARAEENEHESFREWGQWETHANHIFVQYMKRVEAMAAKRKDLATDRGREMEMKQLLARTGATEHAIGIAAGAILQVAKQSLSFRFGGKSALPAAGIRRIGSQTIIEVIWEGRNHAMHWEEFRSRTPADAMLLQLQNDGLARITPGENNAIDVLDAVGWKAAPDAIAELNQLVSL